MIKTFAFLDLETTGLPIYESNLTQITELCIIACSTKHLQNKESRVLHKLSVCVNPERIISKVSAEMTGLSNELLKNDNTFNENTGNLINSFLSQLPEPICLVAHNGTKFDYPLLKTHLQKVNTDLPSSISCCDSLTIFKITQPYLKKYSLTEIYKTTFGNDPANAHNAESDVINLMNCVIQDPKFVETANLNMYGFDMVSPLV